MARTRTHAGFTYITNDGEIEIVGYSLDSKKEVAIPTTISTGFLGLFANNGTVRRIAKQAFKGCGIRSVSLPDSLESIADEAFAHNQLTEVTLPVGLNSVGSGAFHSNNLTTVTIESSATLIAGDAFAGNPNLINPALGGTVQEGSQSTTHPESERVHKEQPLRIESEVQAVKEQPFSYTYEQKDSAVTINGLSGYVPANLVIPSEINGKAVTCIGKEAFKGCTVLTSVVIPDSVTSIGGSAFKDCTGLASVVIPDSTTGIGRRAFEGCSSLAGFKLTATGKKRLSVVDGVLFDNNDCTLYLYPPGRQGAYAVSDSVTGIEDRAFLGCRGLTSVVIPASVTRIGYEAFEGCDNLTSISIPDSVTSIGAWAFEGCSRLTSVVIPDSVTSIGHRVFNDCRGLTCIAIPCSVTSIGDEAFKNCSSLTSLVIPNSVTAIGESTFAGCLRLTSVAIPHSVKSIGASAFRENRIHTLRISEGVEVIGPHAFCKNELQMVEIPPSVTKIGRAAFSQQNPSLTIVGQPGSAAEEYARKNKHRFASSNDAAVSTVLIKTIASEGLCADELLSVQHQRVGITGPTGDDQGEDYLDEFEDVEEIDEPN